MKTLYLIIGILLFGTEVKVNKPKEIRGFEKMQPSDNFASFPVDSVSIIYFNELTANTYYLKYFEDSVTVKSKLEVYKKDRFGKIRNYGLLDKDIVKKK